MTLLELLVKELPSRGGWPQHESNRYAFRSKGHDYFFSSVPTIVHPGDEMVLRTDYETAIKQSGWNGQGLPSVGTECEWIKHSPNTAPLWRKGVIQYFSACTVVIKNDDPGETVGHPHNFEFRPMHTEVDHNREDFANSCVMFDLSEQTSNSKQFFEKLYDAIVAHKIPGVTTVPTVGEIMRATVSCSREDAQKIVDLLNGA